MRYFHDVWNEGDIEALGKLCSKEMVMYDPNLWHDPFFGQERVSKVIDEYLAAFKLFRYTYVRCACTYICTASSRMRTFLVHYDATS
jgi:hypothetical protein